MLGKTLGWRLPQSDSWCLVGRDVSIPNAAWRGELDDGCLAVCRVVGSGASDVCGVSGGPFLHLHSRAHAHIPAVLGECLTAAGSRGLHGNQTCSYNAGDWHAGETKANVSRGGDTDHAAMCLSSMLLIGLACGGQSADPGGSEDPNGCRPEWSPARSARRCGIARNAA